MQDTVAPGSYMTVHVLPLIQLNNKAAANTVRLTILILQHDSLLVASHCACAKCMHFCMQT